MKKHSKFSNVHGEVRFKQKERLTIAFTRNILPHRKQCCKGENSLTTPPRYFINSCNK